MIPGTPQMMILGPEDLGIHFVDFTSVSTKFFATITNHHERAHTHTHTQATSNKSFEEQNDFVI